MGQFRDNKFECKQEEFSADDSYNIAYRKVKRIKGFYSHLRVYIIVNLIIIISSLNRGAISSLKSSAAIDWVHASGLLEWHTYSTALFWGIGILIHAFLVFGSNIFFGNDWEQRKIREFMEKDKSKKWE